MGQWIVHDYIVCGASNDMISYIELTSGGVYSCRKLLLHRETGSIL